MLLIFIIINSRAKTFWAWEPNILEKAVWQTLKLIIKDKRAFRLIWRPSYVDAVLFVVIETAKLWSHVQQFGHVTTWDKLNSRITTTDEGSVFYFQFMSIQNNFTTRPNIILFIPLHRFPVDWQVKIHIFKPFTDPVPRIQVGPQWKTSQRAKGPFSHPSSSEINSSSGLILCRPSNPNTEVMF